MKKIFIMCGILIVLVIGALAVLATMDFNRLGKDNLYVQITADGDEERYVTSNGVVNYTYWYTQTAYDEEGKEVDVKFSAQKNLRHNAYLKLYVKDRNEVSSYDEMQFDELPEKVKVKFE